ncbi:MAG: class I SAM-dependent methyltransferase [Thiohalomonadales bacterium]
MDSKTDSKKKRDWDAYYRDLNIGSEIPEPVRVLREYAYLLPAKGEALDIACGLAGNAFFLARQGLETSAWDSAEFALRRVREIARTHKLSLQLEQRDVEQRPPAKNSFDVLVVSRFLSRPLANKLITALRPNGLLFYQTFMLEKSPDIGPSNPKFLLQNNELLRLFADLRLLVYKELGFVGDKRQGLRNEALLVARKELTL